MSDTPAHADLPPWRAGREPSRRRPDARRGARRRRDRPRPGELVDAYARAGLACFIASAARDGLPVELVVPEDPDVRSWLSRMHRHRGWGRRHRHPGVPAAPVRRHDRRRGHPASGPVGRLPRPGAGPRARASRSRRRRARARRRRLDPERVRLADDHPRDADAPRRVPPARYDCRCSVALPARQGRDRTEVRSPCRAPERTVELARRAAQNRGVTDRLETG